MPESFPNQEETKFPPEDAPLDERCRFFDEHPDLIESKAAWLNNIHFYLPGGINRKFEERFRRLDIKPENELEEKPEGMSERRFCETAREFYRAIDRAIEEAEMKVEDIQRINERIAEADTRARSAPTKEVKEEAQRAKEALVQELYETVIPIYKKLRELGYAHNDLVR